MTKRATGDPERIGTFNYLEHSVRSSLHRTGAVRIRRDVDGSDSDVVGLAIEKRDVPVHDARQLAGEARRTLARNGFELLPWSDGAADLDFLRHEDVVERYYDACAQLVQKATGAVQVFAFDHNVRSARGKKSRTRIAGGQRVQAPAHMVHGDYTLDSAPQRLRDLGQPPTGNDTLRPFLDEDTSLIPSKTVEAALRDAGRFAIINVWRNIAEEPVATHPLALCDAQTVAPEDLVVFEIHYEDRVGENYFAKYAPRHGWYTYPGITRDEALLIKQWDSAGTLARSSGAEGDARGGGAPCHLQLPQRLQRPAHAAGRRGPLEHRSPLRGPVRLNRREGAGRGDSATLPSRPMRDQPQPDGELARAETLPARWYRDPAVLDAERRGIFGREWLLLGHEEELAEPGTTIAERLAGWPVFVRRGHDGELRAFHDVCRHRAGPLVGMPEGDVAHKCRVPRLRCRYHGWIYDEQGRLERAPDFGAAEAFDPGSLSLASV
jgi:nitrite reductase/ring-hydroxylating ferredoxin subunit